MSYRIEFLPVAARQFRKLSPLAQKQLSKLIDALADNPRPPGCKKLTGVNGWRVRSGDFRVVYEIQDRALLILVLHLGNRKDVYRH